MSLPTLNLGDHMETPLASGHPWIYRNHLPRHRLATGDWVRLEAGRAHAVGIYDADGAIGVRIFGRDAVPDARAIARRVDEALALRTPIEATDTDAYRVLFGEGDGLPGITVDRYGRYLSLATYSDGVETVVPDVVRALGKALRPRGIVRRRDGVLDALYGERPPPEITVKEHGLSFLANLYEGQKTGLFLDHRDNRAVVRKYARDAEVLNLFSYTGAFSIHALAGGARRVVDVDVAGPALEDAARNVAANGFPSERHVGLQADAFEAPSNEEFQRAFDLVVVDPPALARSKDQRRRAVRAYERLNAAALGCVRPGGYLATASCTAQVDPETFRGMLADAARTAGVRAQIVHEAGHAPDHPVPVAFPEGRYLKFVLARILPV